MERHALDDFPETLRRCAERLLVALLSLIGCGVLILIDAIASRTGLTRIQRRRLKGPVPVPIGPPDCKALQRYAIEASP